MFKLLLDKVKKNSAFFVMLSSSLCTFLSIYFLKNAATDSIFSLFVLLQIYIGYSITLGALGSDNVVLRYAQIEGVELTLDKALISLYIRSLLLSIIIFIIIGRFMFSGLDIASYYVLLLFIFGSIASSLSICFRLVGYYTRSQIILNGWKLAFLVLIFLCFVNGISIKQELMFLGLLLSMLIFIFYGLNVFKSIKVNVVATSTKSKKEYNKLQFTFAISLLFFAILGSYDRVILKDHLSVNEFAEYSYLVTLLLFPIGIIANYVGFKELIEIKKGKVFNLTDETIRGAFYTAVIYLLYTCFLYVFNDFFKIKFDLFIWIAILIIVLCKVPYSFSSAIIGAKGQAQDLFKINNISIISILVVCFVIWFYGSVYFAIYSVSLIWIIRSLVFYKKALAYV